MNMLVRLLEALRTQAGHGLHAIRLMLAVVAFVAFDWAVAEHTRQTNTREVFS